jgi:hypothetical protein
VACRSVAEGRSSTTRSSTLARRRARPKVGGPPSAIPVEDTSLPPRSPDRRLVMTHRPLGLFATASKSRDVSDRRIPVRRTPPTLKAPSRTHPMHRRK